MGACVWLGMHTHIWACMCGGHSLTSDITPQVPITLLDPFVVTMAFMCFSVLPILPHLLLCVLCVQIHVWRGHISVRVMRVHAFGILWFISGSPIILCLRYWVRVFHLNPEFTDWLFYKPLCPQSLLSPSLKLWY